jgi:cytochrome c oxidase subunit 3
MLFFVIALLFAVSRWFMDIVIEATFQGFHTMKVQQGLRYGMILFIVSEVMFFLSFFWAFFHSSLSPSIWIGCVWPPLGIETIYPWGLPLLNTIILVSSGIGVTYAHRSILCGDRNGVINGLSYAIFLGVLFTLIQLYEYNTASFNINDSIYGSLFYVLTGFHGLHVIFGTVFLFVTLIRHFKYHLLVEHHFGLEASIWYWHFVDVVWLFVFTFLYWWSF